MYTLYKKFNQGHGAEAVPDPLDFKY